MKLLVAGVLSDDQGGAGAWSFRRVVDGLRVVGARLGRPLLSEFPPPSSPGHRGSLQAWRSCARTGRIGRCVRSSASS